MNTEFQLRDYQKDLADKGLRVLNSIGMVYLSMEVRTGKTHTALEIAQKTGISDVLFVTKKRVIPSIEKDHKTAGHTFNLTVINYESLHLITRSFSLVIVDEAHGLGAFPKPSKRAIALKKICSDKVIYLSGTATPESYSQIYHQFWICKHSPFGHYRNFYGWAADYCDVHLVNFGYGDVKQYDRAIESKVRPVLDRVMLSYTQKQAGFTSEVNEKILKIRMKHSTTEIVRRLRKDKVLEGKAGTILADTGAKMMSKIHQICSGTCILEDGNSVILDESKAEFIADYFKNTKIAIFYKFSQELEILKKHFDLAKDLDEFNSTDKSIALQIVSGREGISLSNAKYLVYYNIDFSAVSYWQSRDRLTTIDRPENTVYWLFSVGGIEQKIYEAVQKKKDYTLNHFKSDIFNIF